MAKKTTTARRPMGDAAPGLTRDRAFGLLDRVETALHRLGGTATVAAFAVRAGTTGADEVVSETLDRWLAADRAELDAAYQAAVDGILSELTEGPAK